MSKVHYFQRYSQRENVATNNTLLLFSRLYNESIYKFNDFLNLLMEDTNLEIGMRFNQQQKFKTSIPDGIIEQKSLKIAIETKLNSGNSFSKQQLISHFESFSSEENKILLALSPTKIEKTLFDEISKESKKNGIDFFGITFQDIVKAFNDVIFEYNIQLKDIIDDYEDYCLKEDLIKDNSRIRIIPCGGSYKLNMKYGIYYMPSSRGTSIHQYLGIYTNKAVIGIGKIETEVVAKVQDGELISEVKGINKGQLERLKNIIRDTKSELGWDLGSEEHRYFLVEEMVETNYIKESKGGIQGHRYKSLKEILNVSKLPDIKEIAKLLKDEKWT